MLRLVYGKLCSDCCVGSYTDVGVWWAMWRLVSAELCWGWCVVIHVEVGWYVVSYIDTWEVSYEDVRMWRAMLMPVCGEVRWFWCVVRYVEAGLGCAKLRMVCDEPCWRCWGWGVCYVDAGVWWTTLMLLLRVLYCGWCGVRHVGPGVWSWGELYSNALKDLCWMYSVNTYFI